MKKIIPFLFVVIVLVVLVLMHVHFIQANQAQDELVAPGGDALNIDEVEDVALANREAFSSTTRKLRQMSTESVLTVAPLVTLSGTTTVQVKKSDDRVTQIQVIPRLVPVQPGFGGGSSSQQLMNLPEYKEESGRVDPVVEFEYCN